MIDTLDVPTMAREIGATTHSVRRWILQGKLLATAVPKGREQHTYVVQRRDWEAFKRARQKGESPDPTPKRHGLVTQDHGHAFLESQDAREDLARRQRLLADAPRGCQQSQQALREEYHLTRWYRREYGEVI